MHNNLHYGRPLKKSPTPKLTDVERHKRFVEMAREIGVAETAKVPQSVVRNIVKPLLRTIKVVASKSNKKR